MKDRSRRCEQNLGSKHICQVMDMQVCSNSNSSGTLNAHHSSVAKICHVRSQSCNSC
jgi:hypothetical protein